MVPDPTWRNTCWFLVLTILTGFLLACAGTPASRVPAATELLLESGFRAEPVKSAEHLRKMPNYQFFTIQRQGRTIYVYNDPGSRQVFFGSEEAYYRYKANAARLGLAEVGQAPPSSQPSMSILDWDLYGELHGLGP